MKHGTILFLASALSALSAFAFTVGLWSNIEHALEDRLFADQTVDERIRIIAIDNRAIAELGQWPFPRELFAEGLERLIAGNPRAVGIDVLFAEPSRLGEEDDAELARVLKESTVPVVLPAEGEELSLSGTAAPGTANLIRTREVFSGPAVTYGHINLVRDRDGIVRRIPFSIRADADVLPSFSSAVVGMRERGGVERIVWSGRPGTIPQVSFAELFDDAFDVRQLEGAYVFIGATAADLHDEQPTPVSAGTAMSGVEIQAQVANMLLMDYRLADVPYGLSILWIIALIALPFFAFTALRRIGTALLSSGILFVANLVALVVVFEAGYAGSIVHTTLALLLSTFVAFAYRYFILERERREIRSVFSKYVSSAVLEELLKNPGAVSLGGASAEVTVFFSDIRGFTTLSEKLSPSELTNLLNRYLTRMTDVILEHRGVVDKYIGDAIMAFWGAPLVTPTHAQDAVLSSLKMLRALDDFNQECRERGEPPINIGIGLNTGEVIVGNMGSTQRFDYTIMGDAVNLGSRIEGQTKTYGVRLLASERTIASLKRSSPEHGFLLREIDKVAVKGKTEPVALYEIVEEKRREFVSSMLKEFDLVREAYYRGDWGVVVREGEKLLFRGDDGPTRVILERSMHFLAEPPASWKGVYELTSK